MSASEPLAILEAVPLIGRAAWTRGRGCQPLAEMLSDEAAIPVKGDLHTMCVSAAIDILVGRKMTRFDLVPTVVPHNIDLDRVTSVTIAVGEGPHTPLAAAVGARIAACLGVPGEMATVFRTAPESHVALERLGRFAASYPGMGHRSIANSSATVLLDGLDPSALLVVGAPGGSWIHRQLFAPGHKLQVAAPGGAVVVRAAPRRCFQEAVDATGIAVSPHLSASVADALISHPSVPVADHGELVGIVRRGALEEAGPSDQVGQIMEPPVSVAPTDSAAAARALHEYLDFGPVPVVGDGGTLTGVVLAGT